MAFVLFRRGCLFEDENHLKYFTKYSKPSCFEECRSNLTFKACQCVPFFLIRKIFCSPKFYREKKTYCHCLKVVTMNGSAITLICNAQMLSPSTWLMSSTKTTSRASVCLIASTLNIITRTSTKGFQLRTKASTKNTRQLHFALTTTSLSPTSDTKVTELSNCCQTSADFWDCSLAFRCCR